MKEFTSAELLADRVNGLDMAGIAGKYEIGEDTVHLIFRDAHVLAQPCWTPERSQKLNDLRASGMIFRDIGVELGCTRNSAIAQWHRLKDKAEFTAVVRTAVADTGRPESIECEPLLHNECVEPACRLSAEPGRVICGDHIEQRYLARLRDR